MNHINIRSSIILHFLIFFVNEIINNFPVKLPIKPYTYIVYNLLLFKHLFNRISQVVPYYSAQRRYLKFLSSILYQNNFSNFKANTGYISEISKQNTAQTICKYSATKINSIHNQCYQFPGNLNTAVISLLLSAII